MAEERILVVEDDDEMRELLVSLLTDAGYKVASARDGEVALIQIEARQPDLILLDMVMPGMTGWAFLRRLIDRGLDVPVVVVSGQYAAPKPLGELSSRVAAYIEKPFDLNQLLETCASALKGGERQ
jgi:CheY-like chemotaxis protein